MYLSSTIQRCRFSGPLLDSLINFVLTIIQSYSNVRSGEMNNAKIYALFGAVFVILEAEAFCLLDLCWHLAHTHVSIELPLLLCFVLDCFDFFHSFRLLSQENLTWIILLKVHTSFIYLLDEQESFPTVALHRLDRILFRSSDRHRSSRLHASESHPRKIKRAGSYLPRIIYRP